MLHDISTLRGPTCYVYPQHRVLPLQSRPHMIFQMSGHRDPSQMCTKDMPHEEVAYMVNYLSDSKLLEDWRFGKERFSRANPPPTVSCPFFLSFFELSSFLPSLF